MKKIFILIFLVVFVLGCAQNPAENIQNQNNNSADGSQRTFSLEEVSAHNNSGDCWMVLDGKVYDVTEWIPVHPGGNAILEGCGKDATELFESRPMGSGTPHSQNAKNMAENYYIGTLE